MKVNNCIKCNFDYFEVIDNKCNINLIYYNSDCNTDSILNECNCDVNECCIKNCNNSKLKYDYEYENENLKLYKLYKKKKK